MTCTDYFTWANNDQTFSEFVTHDNVPAVLLVTSGHCGDTAWETLSMNEVIRVNCKGSWMRVIARDSRGRGYSIPVNYPVPFRELPSRSKTGKSLQKIIEKAKFPIEIQVAPDSQGSFKAANESRRSVDLGPLVIQSQEDIYEETFVKANGVVKGRLNNDVIVIPSYIGIRVSVAERNRIQKQLTEQAGKMDFPKALPSMGITQYSPEKLRGGQSVYATIEPDQYLTYCSLQTSDLHKDTHTYQGFQTKINLCPDTDENTYEGIDTKPKPPPAVTKPSKPPVPPPETKPKIAAPELKPKPKPKPTSGLTSAAYGGSTSQRHGQPLPPAPPVSQPNAVYSEIPPQPAPPKVLSTPSNEYEVDYSTPPQCERIKSFDEVPDDLDTLTIGDVCDCLRLLRMPRYVGRFMENQIDGKLLFLLDKSMMEGELEMTGLHSAKLLRFVHDNWRPNFGK